MKSFDWSRALPVWTAAAVVGAWSGFVLGLVQDLLTG